MYIIQNDNAFTAADLKGTKPEPTFAGALSFLRRRYTKDLAGVDVAVTGIPLDTATTSRPGARFGPRAIRAASAQMAWTRPYGWPLDRKSTRLNSSHSQISYAVFCLKKKN